MRKLLKKIGKTFDIAQKGFGRPKSVSTNESIELVEKLILSQEDQPGTHSTPAEIAYELNINCRSVSRIIDQDLDIRPMRWKSLLIRTLRTPRSGQENYCQCILRKN